MVRICEHKNEKQLTEAAPARNKPLPTQYKCVAFSSRWKMMSNKKLFLLWENREYNHFEIEVNDKIGMATIYLDENRQVKIQEFLFMVENYLETEHRFCIYSARVNG